MYFKNFEQWTSAKQRTEDSPLPKGQIRAGEVRWAILGINVGSEIDGKGVGFTRPVLVVHPIGKHLALIIPFSTKLKSIAGYEEFEFQGKLVSLCLHQMKVISQKRILKRQGKISDKRLMTVKNRIINFFALNN